MVRILTMWWEITLTSIIDLNEDFLDACVSLLFSFHFLLILRMVVQHRGIHTIYCHHDQFVLICFGSEKGSCLLRAGFFINISFYSIEDPFYNFNGIYYLIQFVEINHILTLCPVEICARGLLRLTSVLHQMMDQTPCSENCQLLYWTYSYASSKINIQKFSK